jgi:hypothetical protein
MMSGICIKTLAQTDPGTANLKHQWKFENGTADDNVGTLNGTLNGTATVANGDLVTGDAGWVTFDAAALAVNTYTELTVSAWFTSIAGANTGFHFLYYFGNSDGNGNHFTGYTPARGNDVSRLMLNTNGESIVDDTEFDDGLLHHVVCIVDATNISYYLDGNLVNSSPVGNSKLADVGTQFAYIAKGGWNDPNWKGLLHEISVYDMALTADNVKYLYSLNASVPVTPVEPGTTNLKHQWTFDDGTANDVVGNVNGTLNGLATISDKALNTNAGGYVTLDGVALGVKTYKELTIESWFTSLAGANNGYHFLYYFGNSDNNGNHFVGFTPDRDGNPGKCGRTMIATGNGEDGQAVVNTALFNDGRLHQMVCVIDSIDVSNKNITAYLDGNLLGTSSLGTNTLSKVGSDLAYFAKGGWVNDPTWMGLLHKISMYDKALTPANVKSLYNAGPEDLGTVVNQTRKVTQIVYVKNNQIVAQFESARAASAQIDVYNTQGALLSSEKFGCNAGLNNKTVAANYPAGIYVVRLTVAGKAGYTKIVK